MYLEFMQHDISKKARVEGYDSKYQYLPNHMFFNISVYGNK